MAVVLPFEAPEPSIERLSALVRPDLQRVNELILSRTGSEVTMIPEVANHLISSGGKRLRPMLTSATATRRAGIRGDGPYQASPPPSNSCTPPRSCTTTSWMKASCGAARPRPACVWGNEASVLVGDFLFGQALPHDGRSRRTCARSKFCRSAAAVIAEGEVMQLAAAKNLETTEDAYLAVIRAKTAELFAAACEVGPVIAGAPEGRAGRLLLFRR